MATSAINIPVSVTFEGKSPKDFLESVCEILSYPVLPRSAEELTDAIHISKPKYENGRMVVDLRFTTDMARMCMAQALRGDR